MFFRKKLPPYPFMQYPIMQQPSLKPNEGQLAQMNRKFGMFLHFGINTFNNTEWSDGKLPIESYRPSAIDADSWVKTAYEAGMNYVILITKHHDGFCLWDTHTTTYSVNYSPNKTDVVKAVSEACKKYGVKLGLYYSLWDRHEKCYKDNEAYVRYMEKHLTELMDSRYGEVVELWFDGAWDKPCRAWQLDRLYSLVKTMQPMCQIGVNHTVGKYSERKGMPKKGMNRRITATEIRFACSRPISGYGIRICAARMTRKSILLTAKNIICLSSRRSAQEKNSAGFIPIHMRKSRLQTPRRS